MLPVHIVIVNAFDGVGNASKPMMDNYAIIDDSLKLCDIVTFALTSLSLGHLATVSKAFVLFDNWKPLSFEDVTDDQDALVVDVLKPVAHTALVKIVVGQERLTPSSSPEIDVVAEPLDLSQGKARQTTAEPCQMDSETIDTGSEHGSDSSSKPLPGSFVTPRQELVEDQPPMMDFMLQSFLQQQAPFFGHSAELQHFLQAQAPLFEHPSAAEPLPAEKFQSKMTHSPALTKSRYNPMEQAEKTVLVRFDPVTEVPMLHDWFAQNQMPSKVLCQSFTDELNSMPYRQTNPPLSSTTVYNWFKNHRSRGRRTGMRVSVKAEILE